LDGAAQAVPRRTRTKEVEIERKPATGGAGKNQTNQSGNLTDAIPERWAAVLLMLGNQLLTMNF